METPRQKSFTQFTVSQIISTAFQYITKKQQKMINIPSFDEFVFESTQMKFDGKKLGELDKLIKSPQYSQYSEYKSKDTMAFIKTFPKFTKYLKDLVVGVVSKTRAMGDLDAAIEIAKYAFEEFEYELKSNKAQLPEGFGKMDDEGWVIVRSSTKIFSVNIHSIIMNIVVYK